MWRKLILFTTMFCLAGCSEEKKEDTHQSSSNTPTEKVREMSSKDNLSKVDDEDDDLQTLIVGTSADFMPFEYMKNGEIVGFDIDLINAISKKIGKEIVIRDMQFFSLIPALENGYINVAIAGMSSSEERSQYIDFSKPYYFNKFTLLVIGNYDEKNPIQSGMKIGVQTGTTMHQWIKKQELDIAIVSMNNSLELIEDLKNQRLNGVLLDAIAAKDIVKANPSVKMQIIPLHGIEETGISIALQKNSPLLKQINNAISELESDGEIESLKAKWGL